jgi:phage baseplate assembly protein W
MSVTTLPDGPELDLASVTESETIGPSLTYRIRYEKDGQIQGYCDDLEAMKQAIYKIINTERYQYIIYSWNYGIELRDLFGKPIPFVYAEVQRRIEEALLQDDRITKVKDFEFSHTDGDVAVHFNVSTIYGDVNDVEKVVYGVV